MSIKYYTSLPVKKYSKPNINPYGHGMHIFHKEYWTYKLTKDEAKWCSIVEEQAKYLKDYIKINKGCIPKGTKIYHGSLVSSYSVLKDKNILDNIFYKKNKKTFFGLDSVISIWYILELQYNILKYPEPINGYLYEIELIRDLPISHIIEKLLLDDKFDDIFKDDKNICIKPQIGFHNNIRIYKGEFDMCVEIILDYHEFKEYLKLINIYEIDAKILIKNKDKKNWDCRRSLISRYIL